MNDNELIPITRPNTPINPQVLAFQQEQQKGTVQWPTETLEELPTKGYFYPDGHPLAAGKIELKQVTSLQEDILSNEAFIKKGIALEKFLESLIVDKRINTKDVLLSDKNSILVFARRLAYGNIYNVSVKCAQCGKDNDVNVDLSKFTNKVIDFDKYPKGVNSFEFELPFSKRKVVFKLLTQKESDAIDEEIEAGKKINKESSKEVTTRLMHLIQSVDGDTNKTNIRKFVSNELLAKDSLALRRYIREMSPELVTDFDFECNNCEFKGRVSLPISLNFFWPDLTRQ